MCSLKMHSLVIAVIVCFLCFVFSAYQFWQFTNLFGEIDYVSRFVACWKCINCLIEALLPCLIAQQGHFSQ